MLPRAFRVYHATEDYFTMVAPSNRHNLEFRANLRKLLAEVDQVVGVSAKVVDNLVSLGGFAGPTLLAENGCDYEYFAEIKRKQDPAACAGPPTVVFQGKINSRLDFDLLGEVIEKLPHYKFRFLGGIDDQQGAAKLQSLQNVSFAGHVDPDQIALEMLQATVGIIPFRNTELMRNSMPLKTFEYIACGLPVVSIPIHSLEIIARDTNIVQFARSPEDFVKAIVDITPFRQELNALEKREALAVSNSYNRRFASVMSAITNTVKKTTDAGKPLNVAILYDQRSCHVITVREHLEAFRRFSTHDCTYVPATGVAHNATGKKLHASIDLSVFDAVVVHYSVRLSIRSHLNESVAQAVKEFSGLKVLLIQDEYDAVEFTRQCMDKLQFDLVYTCVPLAEREKIYPSYRFPATEFLPTLTGYVPESTCIDSFVKPLEARSLAFVYRGRDLPPIYGQLGREKYSIGEEVLRRANVLGLPVDIACDSASRIYGEDWYRFLGSGRATLGTESGSNVFDFDGSLAREVEALKQRDPGVGFEEIWERVIQPHDGYIRMNQISPKIFESIRLRTALVLFEGEYSGVVRPDVHFIPLKKDFSNFEEVVAKVMDNKMIREMTDRAHEDIIASGRYSYRKFVEGVSRDLRERCLRRQTRRLMYGPVFAEGGDGSFRQCLPCMPLPLPCAKDVLDCQDTLQQMQKKYERALESGRLQCSKPAGWYLPLVMNLRRQAPTLLVLAGKKTIKAVERWPYIARAMKIIWRKLPSSLRSELLRALYA